MTPSRTAYDTDLTDTEWESLVPLVPRSKAGGRPPKHSRREILNGIFYAVRSGGAWKLLPHDLPPWRTVYHYFLFWRRSGVWQQIHDRLREQVREAAGRNPNPSAAILDSQSIRSSEAGGVRGYDAGKKICGRKRHILVDILGLLLLVVVTAANRQDRNGAQLLLAPLAKQFRRLRVIWADGAYAGELETWTRGLRKWGKVRLEIVRKPNRTKRICRPAVEVASGKDLRWALPESAPPLRLRTPTADHRSSHLRGHDPPHDSSAGCLVNLFKLPLKDLAAHI